MVKGKTEPERIYGLIGPTGDDQAARVPDAARPAGRLPCFCIAPAPSPRRLPVIQECAEAAQAVGWRQGYYEVMRERVDHLIDDSPPDWNGVYVAKEK